MLLLHMAGESDAICHLDTRMSSAMVKKIFGMFCLAIYANSLLRGSIPEQDHKAFLSTSQAFLRLSLQFPLPGAALARKS